MKIWISIFLLIIFLLLFNTSVNSGEKTIPFSLKTFKNEVVPIDTLLQKGPVLITFWAMWCKNCKEELQALKRIKSEYPFNKISIVAVNIDTPRNLARARSYVATHRFNFLFCVDPNQKLLKLFNAWAIPFSILVGKEREIVFKHTAFVSGDERKIQKKIKEYLQGEK